MNACQDLAKESPPRWSSEMVQNKRMDLGAPAGCCCKLLHSWTVQPRAKHFTSLCIHVLVCKNGSIVSILLLVLLGIPGG